MDYLIAAIYIILGCLGALVHFYKKRYKDKDIDCSLSDYLFMAPNSTLYALGTIIAAEVVLSLSHVTGWHFPLSEVAGAITAGYTANSGLNKAPNE